MQQKGAQFSKDKVNTPYKSIDSIHEGPLLSQKYASPGGGGGYDAWQGALTRHTYQYYKDQDHLGDSTAMTSVLDRGGTGHTQYPPKEMIDDDPSFNADMWSPGNGQMPLFEHRSFGPESTVTSMGSTRGSRVAAMTQLGIAANEAQDRGRTLLPDDNLSKHSQRVVDRMYGAGMTEEPAFGEPQNTLDFWEPHTDSTTGVQFEGQPTARAFGSQHGETTFSPEEVARGRRTVRSILGRGKAPKSQGEQGTLF
jgi:hypothetical protein